MARILKLRAYRDVPLIRHYAIIESTTSGLSSHRRGPGEPGWISVSLAEQDIFPLPEIGIEIPVRTVYERVVFAEADAESIP